MSLAERLAQKMIERDDLAEQHYQLGGIHADSGTVNCGCDLARQQRTVAAECAKLRDEKRHSTLSVRLRDEALEEAARLADEYLLLMNDVRELPAAIRGMKSGSKS